MATKKEISLAMVKKIVQEELQKLCRLQFYRRKS